MSRKNIFKNKQRPAKGIFWRKTLSFSHFFNLISQNWKYILQGLFDEYIKGMLQKEEENFEWSYSEIVQNEGFPYLGDYLQPKFLERFFSTRGGAGRRAFRQNVYCCCDRHKSRFYCFWASQLYLCERFEYSPHTWRLWYLIGKKEVDKKWLNFWHLTKISTD